MSLSESQDIETATTALEPITSAQPDNKTRRYDRQLRLWAASGQHALETARLLVLSGSATSTSILKNLVLPGIGHFTIIDSQKVTPEDAGNNFFLEATSIGKSRAEEAVRLLAELNDGVEGKADTSDLAEILDSRPEYITSFTLIIAHNLEPALLERLSDFLWSDPSYPPLVIVRSAGFLAEFFIQFHEHTIVDSHSETAPSLRVDKPFPALLEYALSLDFDAMDVTDHSHIPYVVILVRALQEWKNAHGGEAPKTYEEKQAFKKALLAMKKKDDEENFDEAYAQAYRAWTPTTVPSEIAVLFNDPGLTGLGPDSPPFFHLLSALQQFTNLPPHTLPLSAALPDMKADTKSYIHLQKLYKTRAEEEKDTFKGILSQRGVQINDAAVDEFVKNAHGLKILRGEKWIALDQNRGALGTAFAASPREAGFHLSLSALSSHFRKDLTTTPTVESLKQEVVTLAGPNVELPDDIDVAIGEIARAPTADLPTTAAFLGGLVAQETIKVITRQYVPVNGYCVVDLVASTTGIVG